MAIRCRETGCPRWARFGGFCARHRRDRAAPEDMTSTKDQPDAGVVSIRVAGFREERRREGRTGPNLFIGLILLTVFLLGCLLCCAAFAALVWAYGAWLS